VSDFEDIVNGAFSSLAQSPAGQIIGHSYAAHAIRNALGLARAPGDVAKGIAPARPGMMGEEDAFRLGQADAGWQDSAHAGALNLLGLGASFAPKGGLGMAGGRAMTPGHAESALSDIHSGKTLLQGVKNALGLGEKAESGLAKFDPAKFADEIKDLPFHDYMDKKAGLPHHDWEALQNYYKENPPSSLPSLSDKSVAQQLEENPGASIADIAGVPSASVPKALPSTPQYQGYSILKHVGQEDKLNVYAPGGENIGNIFKMGDESWDLHLKDDPEGNIGMTSHPSIGSALEEAARAHKQIMGSESNRYAKYIEPLDWSKMVSPSGAQTAIPEHASMQGYNALYPLYKGTKHVEDYPEKLGTTLLSGKKQWERGLFFADTPDVAGGYGTPLEYVARAEKPMQVDWVTATGTGEYDTTLMHHLIEGARSKGADLLHIRNLEDVDKHEKSVMQNQIIAINPSIVRAPRANFDPARIKENVPLAGIAALGATPLMFDKKGNLLIHLGDKEEDRNGTGKE
jgi:hypothetical protein